MIKLAIFLVSFSAAGAFAGVVVPMNLANENGVGAGVGQFTVKEGKFVAAGSAGGHYDPASTNAHGTPWGEGHLGDLPPLHVEANGSANHAGLAPRLKLSDLQGRAMMVHAGGGARVSYGIIK